LEDVKAKVNICSVQRDEIQRPVEKYMDEITLNILKILMIEEEGLWILMCSAFCAVK
jgi:hypothetical protein